MSPSTVTTSQVTPARLVARRHGDRGSRRRANHATSAATRAATVSDSTSVVTGDGAAHQRDRVASDAATGRLDATTRTARPTRRAVRVTGEAGADVDPRRRASSSAPTTTTSARPTSPSTSGDRRGTVSVSTLRYCRFSTVRDTEMRRSSPRSSGEPVNGARASVSESSASSAPPASSTSSAAPVGVSVSVEASSSGAVPDNAPPVSVSARVADRSASTTTPAHRDDVELSHVALPPGDVQSTTTWRSEGPSGVSEIPATTSRPPAGSRSASRPTWASSSSTAAVRSLAASGSTPRSTTVAGHSATWAAVRRPASGR